MYRVNQVLDRLHTYTRDHLPLIAAAAASLNRTGTDEHEGVLLLHTVTIIYRHGLEPQKKSITILMPYCYYRK